MDLTRKTLDPDAKTKTPPLPNGALKKHHQPGPSPAAAPPLYRECLKNHAASLGGHALDGCGEFMPSASSNPADPTSLTCAACGCHRNFHRRLPHPHEGEEEMDGQDEGNEDHDDNRHSSSPPPSAPHMLLALSAGLSAGPTQGNSNPVGSTQVVGAAVLPRKRFRTKFSPEQKERMHELSEKLGWRMQKRDEGLVEEYCKGIGVGKGVFKVWMHNNKHNFLGLRRGEEGGGGTGSGGGGCVVEGNGSGGDGGDGSNSHVVNGSTSSS